MSELYWADGTHTGELETILYGHTGDLLQKWQKKAIRKAIKQAGRVVELERQLAEAKVKTEVTVGVGSGDGQLFVHGDYESVKAVQAKLLELESLRRQLAERGEPCYHKGCLSLVTHPCEGCGRVAGRSPQNEGTNHD